MKKTIHGGAVIKINEAIKLSPTRITAACDVNREPVSAFLFKLEPI